MYVASSRRTRFPPFLFKAIKSSANRYPNRRPIIFVCVLRRVTVAYDIEHRPVPGFGLRPIQFFGSCNLSEDEAKRTCEYDDGCNSVQSSSHVVKDVKRLTAWTVHVPLGPRIACLDQTSSRMPCTSVARERLDCDICSWLACWGQNASRVAVALFLPLV